MAKVDPPARLRGALLDLLASGEAERTTGAMRLGLEQLDAGGA